MNGTEDTTNDKNKGPEAKVVTQITQPLPPDANLKLSEVPPFPRAGSEPRVPRTPDDDLATTSGDKPRSRWSGPLKTLIVVMGMLAALALMLYSCQGVSELKKDGASLEADIMSLQKDNKANKDDIAGLKKGVDDLNKKVDPMISNVEKIIGTVDALADKVNGLDATKADKTEVEKKVAGSNWRITRIEKKIQETRIAISVGKDPLPTEDKKPPAPVDVGHQQPQPTRNVIYRPVPVYIDVYKPRSMRR
ncbi:MAG: hypothetical protein G01um101413_280 [Parcubacteria group bacterium Gr01-1014_13]|nr:MAG: hypothetical protein G01um101413_280 [Parcubacteria group bacterium Gr01-1014_13]